MKLYDSKFVYFDWDDKLEGKKGFFSDDINTLKQVVKDNRTALYGEIIKNSESDNQFPFEIIDKDGCHTHPRFCYYDPYYEFRRAYLEGKQLQFKNYNDDWIDVEGEPIFTRDEYRIKPETTWYVVLNDDGLSRTNNPVGDATILFEGTEEECIQWMDEHEKFEKIMIAWINGAQIELGIEDPIHGIRWVLATKPTWDISNNYRVKEVEKFSVEPEESVPFDTVQELIDAWEKKSGVNFNHELAMPFIWIKNKQENRVYLITDFYFDKIYDCYDVGAAYDNFSLKELFKDYTFLDGSTIGKVKEEKK